MSENQYYKYKDRLGKMLSKMFREGCGSSWFGGKER